MTVQQLLFCPPGRRGQAFSFQYLQYLLGKMILKKVCYVGLKLICINLNQCFEGDGIPNSNCPCLSFSNALQKMGNDNWKYGKLFRGFLSCTPLSSIFALIQHKKISQLATAQYYRSICWKFESIKWFDIDLVYSQFAIRRIEFLGKVLQQNVFDPISMFSSQPSL